MKYLVVFLSRGTAVGLFYGTAYYLHRAGLNVGAGVVLFVALVVTFIWACMPLGSE
jgi:hypothetical protein